MAHPIDCTVVIPVFNRGEALAAGIESLRAQSIGAGRLEILYVDDGSTDGRTPAMLDRIVEATPNARVFHEPPSGSPGRPRNVGLANAQGEFVFFADHDDWFDPNAIELLVGWARRHESDVVIGKVVGHGRRIPIPGIFRQSRGDIPAATAMISLTPHKLFRREFLAEHDIGYPEGRRRLEDHHFVAHAYLHARRISVYADRVCYHHNHPGDDRNFSQSVADPDVYVAGNRDVIELIRRHTEDDPVVRDGLLVRPVRHELLDKAGPRQLHQVTEEAKQRKHRALRTLLVETVPGSVVDRLGAFPRATAKALRDDDPEAVRRVAGLASAISLTVELVSLKLREERFVLDYRATVARDGVPVRFGGSDRDGWTIEDSVLPRELADRPERLDQLTDVDLEVLVASRRTEVQWHLPASYGVELRPVDTTGFLKRRTAAAQLRISGTAVFDPGNIGTEPVEAGVWDVVVRADALGLRLQSRLAVTDGSALPDPPARLTLGTSATAVSVRVTPKRTLAFHVRRREGRRVVPSANR